MHIFLLATKLFSIDSTGFLFARFFGFEATPKKFNGQSLIIHL